MALVHTTSQIACPTVPNVAQTDLTLVRIRVLRRAQDRPGRGASEGVVGGESAVVGAGEKREASDAGM